METSYAVKKLTEARDLLNEKGWCRGTYQNSRGHYCVYGALREVAWETQDDLATLLRNNLVKVDGYLGLAAWNDEEGRRKRDVLRLFNRTIQKLEAR